MAANVADAKGLTFDCLPGCGFCCTVSPLVAPHEAKALPLAVKLPDGAIRIPISGGACSALGADRRCGAYDARPTVCRLFPYQVHAGRRIQVTVSLACPGVGAQGEAMDEGALRAADLALAVPGASEVAAQAKATFVEFDRRMKEWNVAASPDKFRAAFLPHAGTLAQPGALPALFAGIAEGDFLLEGDAARAVGDLFGSETDGDIVELLADAAGEAFVEPNTVAWVEPDLSWTRVRGGSALELVQGARATKLEIADLPFEWAPAATDALAGHLARLMHRDHTEGAAAWLVDASGYQATPAAAYARVLGEASLHVMLRAAMLAAADGRDEIDLAHARRGIAAYETAYHSLPTLGAIL